MNPMLTRIAYVLGAIAVSGIAAWASWHHMVEVARMTGEDPTVSLWVPLSVDGVLLVASAAMADDKARERHPRTSAKVAFVIGVCASVGANIAAANPNLGARVVAAWPAIALLLVVEMLTRQGKPKPVEVVVEAPAPRPAKPPVMRPAPAAKVTEAAANLTVEDVRPVSPAPRLTPPALTLRATVEAAMLANPDATVAQVVELAGVSESSARRHMKAIRDSWKPVDQPPSQDPPAETPVNGHAQPELLAAV